MSAAMGDAAATNVRPQIHHVDGHDICRVQVDPCGFPVDAKVIYQKPGGPKETRTELFARLGNSTSGVQASIADRQEVTQSTIASDILRAVVSMSSSTERRRSATATTEEQ